MTTKQAWAAFVALGLIWGSSFLFIRVGVEQLTPFQLVFIRTGIAAVGLNVIVLLRGKRLPTDWAGIRALLVLGIVNTVLPFVLITWGETSVESGLASVLQGTAALFTLVVAHFAFTDERINSKKVVGLVTGFIGVVLLSSRSWQEGSIITGDLLGQLAIVAASFCYALGGVYGRKAIQNRLDPIVVAAGAMTVAAIATGILMVVSPAMGGQPNTLLSDLRPNVLFSALMLGFVNTWVAYMLFYPIVNVLGAARTSMVTYIVPLVGLTLGAIVLNEAVDIRLLIGAALIIGGIGIVNLPLLSWLRRTPAPEASHVTR
ncbi:MAG: EamA family transporter [Anaerolineae bacterium]|nr:EamA family transporter [Anaerolineae bacterium]